MKTRSLSLFCANFFRLIFPGEFWLAKRERDITVSDHVLQKGKKRCAFHYQDHFIMHIHYLDLSLHCYAKQSDEVHDQNRPKYGDVEELEERAAERDHRGLRGRVPELEFGQPPNERSKFVTLPRGQFHAFVTFFGLERS